MCCKVVTRIDEENSPQLPDEIIFYILSYLPLSCLLKFTSVCKLWNTLFLHPHLAFLHHRNTNYGGLPLDDLTNTLNEMDRFLKDIEDEDREGVCFNIIARSSQGLLLWQTTSLDDSSPNTNLRYRVECPTLRQRIDIPNPQNPSLCIALDFVPFNHPAVKLLSVHGDDELGYEILALGVGSDQTTYCWRAVKVPLPNLSHQKRKRIQVFFRMGVAYCIWHVERDAPDDLTDIQVDVLDMVNETYIGRTTFPRGFFSSTNLMDWNGRLSFAQLLKDELHVLVLNDYRKLKWDERMRIIKLKFLQPDDGEQLTFITFADNSILFFVNQNKNLFFAYDINTGKLITCTLPNCIESIEEVVHIITEMMFYRGGGFYDY